MKKIHFFNFLIVALMLTTLTSCDIIGGIFEAGVWVGVILVIAVIALLFWLIKKMF